MQASFVLDCSVTMAWFFEDEINDYAERVFEQIKKTTAIAPTIWSYEVSNILALAERKNRINESNLLSFIQAIEQLGVQIDHSNTYEAFHGSFILSRNYQLTVYDAAYLQLAIEKKLPIATLDTDLKKAARKCNIELFIS